MATAVHSDNVLIEFSRTPELDGWVKELIYQTINANGELSDSSINYIFNLLVNGNDATTPEPTIITPLELKLLKIKHVSGVNALAPNIEIQLCEEGITLLFGNNGSGKSGYFWVLNHICGGSIQEAVLGDVFDSSPHPQEVDITYQKGTTVDTCAWTNQPLQRGIAPFNRIGLFKNEYANLLVQKHTPDTYIMRIEGYFQLLFLRKNWARLKRKVTKESSELETKMDGVEPLFPNIDVVYNNYVVTLEHKVQEAINDLIGHPLNIHLEKASQRDGTPILLAKLDKPYEMEDVLSEGERKTIALALFIAEQELKTIKDTIVMDDPVNSLDNTIIDNFANKIATLENPCIVFTHNFLFAESLMSNNLVKRYSTGSTSDSRSSSNKKHLIAYKIYSRGDENGLVYDFEKENAAYHLNCVLET